MLPRRVGVYLIPDPDISKGGIIIPNEAKDRSDQGIIKYLGADCDEFSIGDYVLFSGYTGTNVEIEDEGQFAIMQKDYVVAKLHPPNYQVPGLYYRDKKGWSNLEDLIGKAIAMNSDAAWLVPEIMKLISEENPYFNANYEKAVELVGDAFANSEFHLGNRIGWKHGTKKKEFRDV